MTDPVMVARSEEFSPGDRKFVIVDGCSVGVFNIDGQYYAIENRCAHQSGPVCTGRLTHDIEGEFVGAGERVQESFEDGPAIACPWHGWEYDLRTGEHLGDNDQNFALRTYDVVVDDGAVILKP